MYWSVVGISMYCMYSFVLYVFVCIVFIACIAMYCHVLKCIVSIGMYRMYWYVLRIGTYCMFLNVLYLLKSIGMFWNVLIRLQYIQIQSNTYQSIHDVLGSKNV